ncbi:sugar ABC transporter permease [candidate division KSB3 bacterium]|uniref:Sugar ABC transporter permease n=1 Tax=candidate division KSB3 bacterium TaxID=2044937 RepID=A0A2G6E3S6_9BACT|nr:MAG: sugar ABC transporter permease [candidate division KSB3 bacterium]PIE29391.1 MAG: sugar ABC transporter permease [candidate division KSB3 bacterium]
MSVTSSPLVKRIWKMRVVYLFISPFFILFAIFQLFPLLWSFVLTFHKWNGLGPMRFIGLGNYRYLCRDQMFLEALGNTMLYWCAEIIIVIPVALVLASLLNNHWLKGRNAIQTIMFLPYVSATVAVGLVFSMIFDENTGLINNILVTLGLSPQPWLTSTRFSKIPVMLLSIWRVTPWYMLIIYSGLKSIDPQLYDASKIDGAKAHQNLWYITIPSIAPILGFCFINLSIESFRKFAEPYILTGGGPGTSSMSLVQYLYNNGFIIFKLGYASAIGWALTIILLLISLGQLQIMMKRSKEWS